MRRVDDYRELAEFVGATREAVSKTLSQWKKLGVVSASRGGLSVLEHHRRLYLLLVKRENQIWTPSEREENRQAIETELERLWRTGEIYLEKPDVASERRNILYYLRNVFPQILPELDQ